MTLLGIKLTLLIGKELPVLAPPSMLESLEKVEVTHSDQGRSGFQITFKAGRSGHMDFKDYPLLSSQLLEPFNRVILLVTFNAMPHVLMDGIITDQQLQPSNEPGASKLTVTGEDISVMMDLEKKIVEHPAQADTMIVNKIITSYAKYKIIPNIVPPSIIETRNPANRTPVQCDTDLRYIQTLARKYGYVFYIKPGPMCYTNTAYWGPPIRTGIPQKALSFNMGQATNVESINLRYDALSPSTIFGFVKDSEMDLTLPLITLTSTRPPLSSKSALGLSNGRKRQPEKTEGVSYLQALIQAQGMVDTSLDQVVTANGELDSLVYGDILKPRELVGLRGVGVSYDGLYYVKSVTHNIQKGKYKQRFTLSREGVGATSPVVIT